MKLRRKRESSDMLDALVKADLPPRRQGELEDLLNA